MSGKIVEYIEIKISISPSDLKQELFVIQNSRLNMCK